MVLISHEVPTAVFHVLMHTVLESKLQVLKARSVGLEFESWTLEYYNSSCVRFLQMDPFLRCVPFDLGSWNSHLEASFSLHQQ